MESYIYDKVDKNSLIKGSPLQTEGATEEKQTGCFPGSLLQKGVGGGGE